MQITRVGIIGGGQLGQMMILESKKLGFYFVILDPSPNCPAHSIADEHIVAEFDDIEAIHTLASKVDVVTYEFEHISVFALRQLEEKGHLVYPSSFTLDKIQNKYVQKEWLQDNNIPVPRFVSVNSYADIEEAAKLFGYPLILKTVTGGYDGKGNAVIDSKEEIEKAYNILGSGKLPLMVEEFVDYTKEISVLICFNTKGEKSIFPIAENIHKDNILDETIVPARINSEIYNKAIDVATKAAEAFKSYGMLCIELFVTKDNNVLVNELAPRPHNSGHYTIEGCYTSQFEQHIRAITGLPLGNTELINPTVMKNLIGEYSGESNIQGYQEALSDSNVKVHIYGKHLVSKGRKMGHITVVDKTVDDALNKVRKAHSYIKF